MNSVNLCSLAGRDDNPMPPRFLAPIEFLKIPALGKPHVYIVIRIEELNAKNGTLKGSGLLQPQLGASALIMDISAYSRFLHRLDAKVLYSEKGLYVLFV
jgi:hypothetical protein